MPISWPQNISKWLVNTGNTLSSVDGKQIEIWELQHQDDEELLSNWASHFRNHYCLDEQIDDLRAGTGYSRSEYLINMKFPDSRKAPGPSIRAGDFAEILTADYLEFILGYWVPRTRYVNKTVRNESTKGSDTIGFLFENEGEVSPKDVLTIVESKANFTGNDPSEKLQEAIDHSAKDVLRKAESLNAIKQRFLDKEDTESVKKIARFQNEVDIPYRQKFGAAAHLNNSNYNTTVVSSANCSEHPFRDNLFLIVIKGDQMMSLVHNLYKRAIDEA